MCISNNSKVLLIAKICIEMYGNSMMLLLDAIMLKANTAPNSKSTPFYSAHVHKTIVSSKLQVSESNRTSQRIQLLGSL